MHIQETKQRIKKGDIAPVYVLYGSQKFLMDEFIQELSTQILDQDTMDFNFESFDLNEHPVDVAIGAAQTFPFIGNKRLILATEALFLTGAKTQSKVEHDLTHLEHYIDSPADFSVLVLIVPQEKLDERKKIVKLLKRKAVICDCSALQNQQLIPWLQEVAKQNKADMNEDAAAILIQFVGGNMQLLSKEVEKMSRYVGREGSITVRVVEELVSKNVEQDVFSLVDHVVHYRIAKAFDSFHELLKRNEEPIKILFLLARQFRMIFKAKELSRSGYSPQQMAQQLGIHPYVCKLVTQQGKNFSEQQLLSILDQLAETDYLMKIGKIDKVLAIEMFLLKLQSE